MNTTILIFIVAFLVIVCIAAGIVAVITYLEVKKKEADLNKLKFYADIDMENCKTIILNIIEEEMDSYKIMNFAYQDYPYITEDEIKEMITGVTTNVVKRMNPILQWNLSCFHKIETYDDMVQVIGNIVTINVITYASEVNTPK